MDNPLIPLCFIIVLSISLLTFQLRRKIKEQQQKIDILKNDLDAILACSRGVSKCLHDHQQQFFTLADRQDKLETSDPGDVIYKQAIALMEKGATEDEMVNTCELTHGELELIAHIQKAERRMQHHGTA